MTFDEMVEKCVRGVLYSIVDVNNAERVLASCERRAWMS